MRSIGEAPGALALGATLLGLAAAGGAHAETLDSCMQPLAAIQEELTDADEFTRGQVNALVEAARELCEADKPALAEEKFDLALEMAQGPQQGPVER